MILKTKLFGRVYEFKSVKEVLAKANEYKSGRQAGYRFRIIVALQHLASLPDFQFHLGTHPNL